MDWNFMHDNIAKGSFGALTGSVIHADGIDTSIYKNSSLKINGVKARFCEALGYDISSKAFDNSADKMAQSNVQTMEIAKQRRDGLWDVLYRRRDENLRRTAVFYTCQKSGVTKEEALQTIESFNNQDHVRARPNLGPRIFGES